MPSIARDMTHIVSVITNWQSKAQMLADERRHDLEGPVHTAVVLAYQRVLDLLMPAPPTPEVAREIMRVLDEIDAADTTNSLKEAHMPDNSFSDIRSISEAETEDARQLVGITDAKELVQFLTDRWSDTVLDDDVHDAKSAEATQINNSGMAEQIAYLAGGADISDLVRTLAERLYGEIPTTNS